MDRFLRSDLFRSKRSSIKSGLLPEIDAITQVPFIRFQFIDASGDGDKLIFDMRSTKRTGSINIPRATLTSVPIVHDCLALHFASGPIKHGKVKNSLHFNVSPHQPDPRDRHLDDPSLHTAINWLLYTIRAGTCALSQQKSRHLNTGGGFFSNCLSSERGDTPTWR